MGDNVFQFPCGPNPEGEPIDPRLGQWERGAMELWELICRHSEEHEDRPFIEEKLIPFLQGQEHEHVSLLYHFPIKPKVYLGYVALGYRSSCGEGTHITGMNSHVPEMAAGYYNLQILRRMWRLHDGDLIVPVQLEAGLEGETIEMSGAELARGLVRFSELGPIQDKEPLFDNELLTLTTEWEQNRIKPAE